MYERRSVEGLPVEIVATAGIYPIYPLYFEGIYLSFNLCARQW